MASAKLSGLGVMFLTMEPIHELVEYAVLAEREGFHSFWLGEAYHWFRHFKNESRSSITIAAAIACNTTRIGIGLGIVSAYTRHPTICAIEAASLDELSHGRLHFGLGVGKLGINYLNIDTQKLTPVATHRDSVAIVRKALAGEAFHHQGKVFHAEVPAVAREAVMYRRDLPIYLAATGPKMCQLAGEISDGLLLPSLTSPGLVRYAREQLAIGAKRTNRSLNGFPIGAVLICCVAKDGKKARDRARKMTSTYLANKLQNIKNETLLQCAGLTAEDLKPMRDALARGERGDLSAYLTDEILRKTSVIVGTPEECVGTLKQFTEAGLTLPLLEVAGETREDKMETIRLAAREIAPHVV